MNKPIPQTKPNDATPPFSWRLVIALLALLMIGGGVGVLVSHWCGAVVGAASGILAVGALLWLDMTLDQHCGRA